MNPFLLPPSERLSAWRVFRQTLESMEEMDQLKAVSAWVDQAPLTTYVLDYDNPSAWASPWELINRGDFDDVAKAYLMMQTLRLAGWNHERLFLHYVRNSSQSFQTMMLLVDNTWALNYQHSCVVKIDKERPDCAYLISYRVNPEGGLEQV